MKKIRLPFCQSPTLDTRRSTLGLRAPFILAALIAGTLGCTSPKPPEPETVPTPPDAPEVVKARELFDGGRTEDAITACIDLSRKNPEARGLTELQRTIAQKLAEERTAAVASGPNTRKRWTSPTPSASA
jgi:hypothetical protein